MKSVKWNIEPINSEASFRIKKWLLTTITGQFETFEGQAETETEEFGFINRICFKAAVNSIKTDDDKRDEHLKSADFFDIENYPSLLFVAENFQLNDRKIKANLRIKDITKPVILNIESDEKSIAEDGKEKMELSISGKINRKDFGLIWNGKNAAGEIIVGDEITMDAKIQFVKEAQNVSVKEMKECVL